MKKIVLIYLILFLGNFRVCGQSWLQFGAHPSYVNCGTTSNYIPTGNQFTLEAITTNLVSQGWIVSKHNGGGVPAGMNFCLGFNYFGIQTTAGEFILTFNDLQFYNDAVAQNCNYYHIAATYDGANMMVYINGNIVRSRGTSGTIVNTNTQVRIGLGGGIIPGSTTGADQQRTGHIEQVRIWNVARSQAQIQANMGIATNVVGQAGLQAFYRFNSLTDLSGNGYTATAINASIGQTPPTLTTSMSATTDRPNICAGLWTNVSAPMTGAIKNVNWYRNGTFLQTIAGGGSSWLTDTPPGSGAITYTARINEGCEDARSASVVINVTPVPATPASLTWTGEAGTAWNNPANWANAPCGAYIPSCNTHAIIPNTTNKPVVNITTATAKTVTVQPGGRVDNNVGGRLTTCP